jgi:hypothetical protein
MNFDGWILVMNGGQMLVGKLVDDDNELSPGNRLSPVYDLSVRTMQGPGGQVGIARILAPVMFADVPYVNLPESYAWLPISALGSSVQREIAKGIEQAEALRMQLRAAESGLVIAGNVPAGPVGVKP